MFHTGWAEGWVGGWVDGGMGGRMGGRRARTRGECRFSSLVRQKKKRKSTLSYFTGKRSFFYIYEVFTLEFFEKRPANHYSNGPFTSQRVYLIKNDS